MKLDPIAIDNELAATLLMKDFDDKRLSPDTELLRKGRQIAFQFRATNEMIVDGMTHIIEHSIKKRVQDIEDKRHEYVRKGLWIEDPQLSTIEDFVTYTTNFIVKSRVRPFVIQDIPPGATTINELIPAPKAVVFDPNIAMDIRERYGVGIINDQAIARYGPRGVYNE